MTVHGCLHFKITTHGATISHIPLPDNATGQNGNLRILIWNKKRRLGFSVPVKRPQGQLDDETSEDGEESPDEAASQLRPHPPLGDDGVADALEVDGEPLVEAHGRRLAFFFYLLCFNWQWVKIAAFTNRNRVHSSAIGWKLRFPRERRCVRPFVPLRTWDLSESLEEQRVSLPFGISSAVCSVSKSPVLTRSRSRLTIGRCNAKFDWHGMRLVRISRIIMSLIRCRINYVNQWLSHLFSAFLSYTSLKFSSAYR